MNLPACTDARGSTSSRQIYAQMPVHQNAILPLRSQEAPRRMPKEVEIKFPLTDKPALERKLRRLGFRRITPETYEANTLYDLPGNVLRRRGELLRLRRYGTSWILTTRPRLALGGRHKSRLEREVRVADGEALAGILQALRFVPVFRYEKFPQRVERWSGPRRPGPHADRRLRGN